MMRLCPLQGGRLGMHETAQMQEEEGEINGGCSMKGGSRECCSRKGGIEAGGPPNLGNRRPSKFEKPAAFQYEQPAAFQI